MPKLLSWIIVKRKISNRKLLMNIISHQIQRSYSVLSSLHVSNAIAYSRAMAKTSQCCILTPRQRFKHYKIYHLSGLRPSSTVEVLMGKTNSTRKGIRQSYLSPLLYTVQRKLQVKLGKGSPKLIPTCSTPPAWTVISHTTTLITTTFLECRKPNFPTLHHLLEEKIRKIRP